MRWQSSSRRSPIGIDTNGRFMHAVQLVRTSGGTRIEAAASIPRSIAAGPMDREAVERLAGVLDRQGFKGDDVVLAVPVRQLLFCHLNVPAATPSAAMPQIARTQLAASHKCTPQSLEVACWELPAPARAREGRWAQVVGCPTAEAQELIDCFDAVGMNVRALDVESWAAARACGAGLGDTTQPAAFLNLGWTAAHLVVVRGGTVVHERSLPDHGLRNLHAPFAEVFDLEPDVTEYIIGDIGLGERPPGDAGQSDVLAAARKQIGGFLDGLVPEVERSLLYSDQEHGEPVADPLRLHGEGAAIPGAAEHLSSALGRRVETVAPVTLTSCSASTCVLCGTPALITAFGLALHPGDR